jgi:hypothetical protein
LSRDQETPCWPAAAAASSPLHATHWSPRPCCCLCLRSRSVCTSINEIICHGIPDRRPLQNGDIVNVDVSVYYNGWHGGWQSPRHVIPSGLSWRCTPGSVTWLRCTLHGLASVALPAGDLNETFVVGETDEASKQLVKVTYEVRAALLHMWGCCFGWYAPPLVLVVCLIAAGSSMVARSCQRAAVSLVRALLTVVVAASSSWCRWPCTPALPCSACTRPSPSASPARRTGTSGR